MHRIAFDPSLPVVAGHRFMAKGQTFEAGSSVDWRALGVDERMALDWWLAGTISHPLDATPTPPPPAIASPAPAPQRKRAAK